MAQPPSTGTSTGPGTDFDRAIALTPVDGQPGRFAVELDDGWASLVGMHGGYMCAVAVRGAEALAPDRPVRTLTTSFLRIGQAGPAELAVHGVRQGRTLSIAVAELSQGGRPLLTSRLTSLVPREGLEWSAPVPVPLPPPEECEPIGAHGPIVHFERVEGRLDPATPLGGDRDRALLRGYLRPREGRAVDAAWLAMATDWFPPPAFARVAPPTGGVSIDLTTHVHRSGFTLGDDEWLTGVFAIETSTGGLAVEHGRIARRDGTLVAESLQTRLTAA